MDASVLSLVSRWSQRLARGLSVIAALAALSFAPSRNAVAGDTATGDDHVPAQDARQEASSSNPTPTTASAPTARGSQILAASFYSRSMQATRRYAIYLPPSYQVSDMPYGVLYLLHGDGGDQDSWPGLGVQSQLDRAFASGRLPEMIVVMPDGSGPSGESTDWANRFDGGQAIEGSVMDLVTDVDLHYRTIGNRATRFIGGFSAGGFGALNIALHHPDVFSVAMSFSGFAADDDPAADPGVFGTDPTYVAQNSPADLIRSDGAYSLAYVLTAGAADAYFQQATRVFASQLNGAGLPYEFHVVPGGHEPVAWTAGLGAGLDYLAATWGSHTPQVSQPSGRVE